MRINYIENTDPYYYRDEKTADKNATQLNYTKTNAALISLYKAATNPDIKLRYAYQLVRFNHYSRKYQPAIDAFQTYVEPLKLKNHMYYYALDQKAGAERGLKLFDKANWDFFQVFKNTKNNVLFYDFLGNDALKKPAPLNFFKKFNVVELPEIYCQNGLK